jgi:predicted nicotinamide N-methyase
MNCARKPSTTATPREALGPVQRQTVMLGDQEFMITAPTQTDRLLDHPYVHEAFAADEYLPYWVELWPAARMLAKAVLREAWRKEGQVLELGCGLGLPGLAALSKGLPVIFSDYDETALQFASDNAKLNGYTEFRTLWLDWRFPPENLRVPILLASDLTYELRNVESIVETIKQTLLPDGICLLTDQDRTPAGLLRERLADANLSFTTEPMRAGEPGERRVRGTLYRIRHRNSAYCRQS